MDKKTPALKFYELLKLLPSNKRGKLTRPIDVCVWEINISIDDRTKCSFIELQKEGLSKENFHYDSKALNDNKLIIKYKFSINDRIFTDMDDFKKGLLKAKEKFYTALIFDNFIFQETEEKIHSSLQVFYTRYSNLEKILKIFANNSHHYENEKGYMLYIDPTSDTENANVKLVTKLSKLSNHYDILDQDITFKSLKTFENNTDAIGTNICVREKAILRNTLLDFITNKADQSNIFDEAIAVASTYSLLKSHEEFDNKFDANLQIYLKDISIDKLKLEITTEQLKCSDQVSKIIQDVISKVFIMSSIQTLIVILLRKDQLDAFIDSNIINPSFFIVSASFFTLLSLYSNASQLYLVEQSINVVNEKIKNQLNSLPNKISKHSWKTTQFYLSYFENKIVTLANFLSITEKKTSIEELFKAYKKGIVVAKRLFMLSIIITVTITSLLISAYDNSPWFTFILNKIVNIFA